MALNAARACGWLGPEAVFRCEGRGARRLGTRIAAPDPHSPCKCPPTASLPSDRIQQSTCPPTEHMSPSQ
eukprot:2821205-Rhodomonas_salina.1